MPHVQTVTDELTSQYDARQLHTSKGYISQIESSFEQLKEIECALLNYGPLGDVCKRAQNMDSMLRITSKSLEITGIPYLTEDQKELEVALQKYFKAIIGNDLAGLACRVHGDLKRAIAVFTSCEGKTKHLFDSFIDFLVIFLFLLIMLIKR